MTHRSEACDTDGGADPPAEQKRFKLHWTSVVVLVLILLSLALGIGVTVIRGDAEVIGDIARGSGCFLISILLFSYGAFRLGGRSNLAGNITLVSMGVLYVALVIGAVALATRARDESELIRRARAEVTHLVQQNQEAVARGDTEAARRFPDEIRSFFESKAAQVTGLNREGLLAGGEHA